MKNLLRIKIAMNNQKSKIAVCGLGYVGLPVALLLAKAGHDVLGIDLDEQRIKNINRGINPIKGREPGLSELLKNISKKKNFCATTEETSYQDRDIIIVAVQTPVDENHRPTYEHLKAALRSIAHNLKKNALIIIESTIAPKTMEEVVMRILEDESGLILNQDFLLANCPERVMPGRLLYNLTHYDRIVGAFNQKAGKIVKNLYEKVLGIKVDITDPLTAEIVKAGENTYRDVQIAWANEMALLCEAYGADVWQVRDLINKCPHRAMHLPGAGVGGHCIPKDSWLLIYAANPDFEARMIPLARQINDFMPKHMFNLLKIAFEEAQKDILKAKVIILGLAYDANSDDTRNSPSYELIKILDENKIRYNVHDPFVKEYKTNLNQTLKGSQAIVLMTSHDEYKKLNLNKLRKLMRASKPIIIDGRNVFSKDLAREAGFIYKGVGNI